MNDRRAGSAGTRLVRRYVEGHPVDAARVMARFAGQSSAAVIADLPVSEVFEVVGAMPDHAAADCVAALEPEKGAAVLGRLDLDHSSALLRRIGDEQRRRLLAAMPAESASLLHKLLAFPTGTAGSLMDPTVLSAPDSLTAGEALDLVRAAPHLALYYLYLYDGSSRLSGVVNLRELMLAVPERPLSEFMATGVESLPAAADRREILVHPGWTEYHALPVVDEEGRFVGALRYETLRRLEGEARTEPTSAALAASLGELYWVGLSGILRGLGEVVASATRRTGEERDAG